MTPASTPPDHRGSKNTFIAPDGTKTHPDQHETTCPPPPLIIHSPRRLAGSFRRADAAALILYEFLTVEFCGSGPQMFFCLQSGTSKLQQLHLNVIKAR